MDILVSFCNLQDTPGRPALGLLDDGTMDFRVVEFPPEVPPATGMTGLAASSRYVFIGLQTSGGAKKSHSPSSLLIFDRFCFKLLNHYVFSSVKDIHSLWLSKNEVNLYAVSSGTDEVVSVQIDGFNIVSEQVYWRPEPQGKRKDNFHINTVYEWNDEVIVMGFGKKQEGEQWKDIRNGFIHNVNRNQTIVSGLEHPHSMAAVDRHLAYCESGKRLLRFTGIDHTVPLPGFTRGLCIAEGKLFVGTSVRRKKSKSTGKLNYPTDLSFDSGECTVSRVSLDSFEVEKTVSLRNYAEEIYELFPIENTDKWPIPKQDFRPFEQTWKEQIEIALHELSEVVPKGGTVILADENEWDLSATRLNGYRRLYFLEGDGMYLGKPPHSETAIHELEQMRKEQGANFIAFGWPSFWWFDHYNAFYTYLCTKFNCILDNDRLVVFDLQKEKPF